MHSVVLTAEERSLVMSIPSDAFKNWRMMGAKSAMVRKLVSVGILEYNNGTRTMIKRKV